MKKNIKYALGATVLLVFGGLYYQNCGQQIQNSENAINNLQNPLHTATLTDSPTEEQMYQVALKDGTRVVFKLNQPKKSFETSYQANLKDGTKVVFKLK